MIQLSRPIPDQVWLDNACAAVAKDPSLAGIVVDRLQEWETPLSDVLLAFAGNQEPVWVEVDRPKTARGDRPWMNPIEPFTLGLGRPILVEWLLREEPERMCVRWPEESGTISSMVWPEIRWFRWEAVREAYYGGSDYAYLSGSGQGARDTTTMWSTEAAAIRDMKARILGLFPECDVANQLKELIMKCSGHVEAMA